MSNLAYPNAVNIKRLPAPLACPVPFVINGDAIIVGGMSPRLVIAAQLMSGILSDGGTAASVQQVASDALMYADALIAAEGKKHHE